MLTETFGLFTDPECTEEFGGFYDLIHYTDNSDNPQDFTLYLGSLGSGGADTNDRKIQAVSDPGVDNITITPTYILPEWDNATAYVVGDCIEPTTPDGFRYRCTDAGTSHATTEPVWSGMGGIGSTIVDNGVIWTKVSAKHAITEIILGLTEISLASNTPGVALSVGHTVESTEAEAVEFWVRVVNAVNTVSNNVSTPELSLRFNSIFEDENV